MMKLLKCGGVTYEKIAVNCFLERKEWKMSKFFCKLFDHKWDNALYIRVCGRCRKIEWCSENSELKPYDK
ncbi:DUF1660 family phage protein [Lactococcus petauri]|uniref:DUF1660 family phage protein n=1 Tax=Lactococcus TaxID=1357 RepID=UPI003A4D7610